MDLNSLERHELSSVWGDMPENEFNALVRDIDEVGIRDPIVLYEGKVLDGWHRTKAAIALGLTSVPFVEFEGDDPAGFAIRRNALRRHLSKTQRVTIALQVRLWADAGRPKTMSERALERADAKRTNKELAEEAGASVGTVKQVKKRIREGHGDDLRTGKETLASLTKKERQEREQDPDHVPLTRMERLVAENERLRMERDSLREQLDEMTKARDAIQIQLDRALGNVDDSP